MNRGDGLIQRRNVTKDVSGTQDNYDVEERPNEEESSDNDSKETRLTLMEEVLLLGLKDKEVTITVDYKTFLA